MNAKLEPRNTSIVSFYWWSTTRLFNCPTRPYSSINCPSRYSRFEFFNLIFDRIFTNGYCNRFFNIPSAIKSSPQIYSRYFVSCCLKQKRVVDFFTIKLYKKGISPITCLLCDGRPNTILRRIIFIWVYPLKSGTFIFSYVFKIRFIHVFFKVFKFQPPFANLYTSPAITRVSSDRFIFASRTHSKPSLIKRMCPIINFSCHSMLCLFRQTTTTAWRTVQKQKLPSLFFVPTVARKLPNLVLGSREQILCSSQVTQFSTFKFFCFKFINHSPNYII